MSRGVKYEKDEKICKDILRIVKPLGSIVNPRIVIKPHKNKSHWFCIKIKQRIFLNKIGLEKNKYRNLTKANKFESMLNDTRVENII